MFQLQSVLNADLDMFLSPLCPVNSQTR